MIQRNVLAPSLERDQPFTPPAPIRLLLGTPLIRDVPARIIAYGLWPVHVEDGQVLAAEAPPA